MHSPSGGVGIVQDAAAAPASPAVLEIPSPVHGESDAAVHAYRTPKKALRRHYRDDSTETQHFLRTGRYWRGIWLKPGDTAAELFEKMLGRFPEAAQAPARLRWAQGHLCFRHEDRRYCFAAASSLVDVRAAPEADIQVVCTDLLGREC